jgi:hypothetical protein
LGAFLLDKYRSRRCKLNIIKEVTVAIINTLPAYRDYIKRKLGFPVIAIEVADEQIDQIIEDSVQDFHRYTYGESTYRDALTITLSAGVSAYYLGPSVESVLDISLTNMPNNINTLFTPQHQILYQDWINGQYPAGSGGTNGPGGLGGAMVMSNYDISMIYLKEIEDHFMRKYTVQFDTNDMTLRVWPTPTAPTFGLLQVYTRQTSENLYNNPLLKKLVVARTMIQWGLHLIKYQINLPGGAGINASTYLEKGERDEAAALESMRTESAPPVFMIG